MSVLIKSLIKGVALMLPFLTVPAGLPEVLEACRAAFTAPTFRTFTALVVGLLGATGPRTVTGMWVAAGMAERIHWARAHRFFSHASWDPDRLGLALARVVVATLIPAGGAVTVAIDDSLFKRCGKKVFGVAWQHDGSARGRDGFGRGTCFVIAGLVVSVPFTTRAVCLPVLFRLFVPVPKTGDRAEATATKPDLARQLVDLLEFFFADRAVHVVADAAYRSPVWRDLPEGVTFTSRLPVNSALFALPGPAPAGTRGRPRLKGERLGSPAQIGATAVWRTVTVTRYGVTAQVRIAEVTCLWWGSLHQTPVRVILVRETTPKRADLALVTTDPDTTTEQIIERYAGRWSIEQTIKDCKTQLGAGQAASRLPDAVRRTVPFTMLGLTILMLWYQHTGTAAADITARRAVARWYRHKTTASVTDMLTAFRRARITAMPPAHSTPDLISHEPLTRQPIAA